MNLIMARWSLTNSPFVTYEDKKTAKMRNQLVGFIFQSFHLIKELNIYDNVELPLIYRKTPAGERKERVMDALEKVGLTNRMQHYPSTTVGRTMSACCDCKGYCG